MGKPQPETRGCCRRSCTGRTCRGTSSARPLQYCPTSRPQDADLIWFLGKVFALSKILIRVVNIETARPFEHIPAHLLRTVRAGPLWETSHRAGRANPCFAGVGKLRVKPVPTHG